MVKILLVEDDSDIIRHLTSFLQEKGFSVRHVDGQNSALEFLERETFDLVLMDVSLREGNGFSACRAIKERFGLPVIFLTASGDEFSTVTGFDAGADDYIAKPFRPAELVSRIRNILRLTGSTGAIIQIGNVSIDTEKAIVRKNGADVNLSALEYRLLLIFLNHRGQLMTRRMLLEAIWDIAGDYVNDNTLTVYVKRLREKLEDDARNPEIIRTVRGQGYRMEE